MSALAYNHIQTLLEGHKPFDHKEQTDIELIKVLVDQHDDIMSRTCMAGHITASALVMNLQTGKIMLHHHKTLAKWLQFGGHMESEETDPFQTAFRETKEESGLSDLRFWLDDVIPLPIDIDVHIIPRSATMPEHPHLDFRYLLLTETSEIPYAGEDESNTFMWLLPGDASQIVADSALLRLITKAELRWKNQRK